MSCPDDAALAVLRRAVKAATGQDPGGESTVPPEALAQLEGAVVHRHLEQVLLARWPDRGLEYLQAQGALLALVPEVAALVGFGEGDPRHKDVWEHSKRVVIQSPARAVVRWAALLHDIGKVSTRELTADGQVHFHGHAEVGARLCAAVLQRLAFPREEARTVRLLVLFHQRPSQYESGWTDSAVRRFARETAEVLDDLLELSRADMTTRYEGKRRRGHELIDELARRIAQIREEDARVPPLPKGVGLAIMERFGLPPGPRVGQLREALEAAVDRGELEPQQESDVYLEWLAERLGQL